MCNSRSLPGGKMLDFKHWAGRPMQRREFIRLFGGVAAAWSLEASAQQPKRMRRVGGIYSGAARFGLAAGRNVRIDYQVDGTAEGGRTPDEPCRADVQPSDISLEAGRGSCSIVEDGSGCRARSQPAEIEPLWCRLRASRTLACFAARRRTSTAFSRASCCRDRPSGRGGRSERQGHRQAPRK